jgi:hypothetical protein
MLGLSSNAVLVKPRLIDAILRVLLFSNLLRLVSVFDAIDTISKDRPTSNRPIVLQ